MAAAPDTLLHETLLSSKSALRYLAHLALYDQGEEGRWKHREDPLSRQSRLGAAAGPSMHGAGLSILSLSKSWILVNLLVNLSLLG